MLSIAPPRAGTHSPQTAHRQGRHTTQGCYNIYIYRGYRGTELVYGYYAV